MKPRYSFSSRHTGQARDPANIKKQKTKFPEAARKVLEESDIILQILDARFIKDTRNAEIEKIISKQNKIIIYVVNKTDLISKIDTQNLPKPYSLVSCTKRKGTKDLRDKIKRFAKKINKEKVNVGVLGYPNTGKSSLINLLIGKKSAPSSSQAGYTKGSQKLKLSSNIMLLDTPGVIPKSEYTSSGNKQLAKHTKVSARSYSQIKDPETMVFELMKEFPNVLEKHYKISAKGDSEKLLEALGRQKNILKKRGEVDFDKISRYILKDWQEGKIKI